MTMHTPAASRGQAHLCATSTTHRKSAASTSRTASRGLAVVLWAIGSAYLTRAEYAHPTPDLVVIAATPIVWAAVIALPILAHRAMADRAYTAALLLALSAVIGSAYTLAGTLGRQAEARDTRVAAYAESHTRRDTLRRSIETEEAELGHARRAHAKECGTGTGKRCAGHERVIDLYETSIKAKRRELSDLSRSDPAAGERRIAAVIGLVSDRPSDKIERAVGLVLPCLLGLLLEIAALGCGLYGWGRGTVRPSGLSGQSGRSGQSDSAATGAAGASETATLQLDLASGAQARYGNTPAAPDLSSRKSEVLALLLTDLALGRPAPSQKALCERFGVARSTMSDWLREWEASGMIGKRRSVGRCKAVTSSK